MKKNIFISCLVSFSLLTSISAQTSTAKWQPTPISIDGNEEDWGTLLRFFNSESNVKYEFRNDAQNLYIILKSADRATQMQLAMAGFNVKLKVKTSPPTRVALSFPAMKMGGMPPLANSQSGKMEKLEEKTAINPELMPKDSVILDGFTHSKGKIVSNNEDKESISFARSKPNQEQATYEIRIPLSEIYGKDYALETVSATPVQLQVSINELSQKAKNGEKSMGRGRRSGGMGGGRSGGMRGGMGGGEMGGGSPGGEMGGGMPDSEGMGGGDMEERPQMQERGMNNQASFTKKTFSIDFKLSTGK